MLRLSGVLLVCPEQLVITDLKEGSLSMKVHGEGVSGRTRPPSSFSTCHSQTCSYSSHPALHLSYLQLQELQDSQDLDLHAVSHAPNYCSQSRLCIYKLRDTSH
jgi:hypothetical protein